jgi:hypothetical protein
MNISEVISIIKNHKKYSNFEFCNDYSSIHVIYKIKEKEYKIDIIETLKKISFYYPIIDINGSSIHIIFNKNVRCDTVLSKFRKIIKSIDLLDIVRRKREEFLAIIKPAIQNYIKKEFLIEYNFDTTSKKDFSLQYPRTVIAKGKRMLSSEFDITKETIESVNKLIYDMYVVFYIGNTTNCLYLRFDSEKNKLTLSQKSVVYDDYNDITKIIRSEKLKMLMLINDEKII